MKDISRRRALQALTIAPAFTPLDAASRIQEMRNNDTPEKSSDAHRPQAFSPHQYEALCSLCDKIIPSDETSGGAIDAGAPELIDLLASENQDYKSRLAGGLQWLDSTCNDRYGHNYLECAERERDQILQLVAYRENAQQSPELSSGIAFFSFLRDLTLGGYYTSETGMKSLPYLGNRFLTGFPGCPPIPES
jgi:Gluconate 2-dehydrogenase subunit 3